MAFFKAYLFSFRKPFKYRVISRTDFFLHVDAVIEEISFIGVMEDKPDITPHSIIHKLVPIKIFYGEWHEQ